MVNTNKLIQNIKKYNDFIREKTSIGKNLVLVYRISRCHLFNAFSFMILNRVHNQRIKAVTTKFLDEAAKNLNLCLFVWDKILSTDDYFNFNRRPDEFYIDLNNKNLIDNFYQIGLAIDELIKLFQDTRKVPQLINFKKRNLLLVVATIDSKKMYVEIDPSKANSMLYQNFLSIFKKEVLEYIDLQWKDLSLSKLTIRQVGQVKDFIVFCEHMLHFITNFGHDHTTDTIEKKIFGLNKFLGRLMDLGEKKNK